MQQPLLVPGWAPRSPVCMERSHLPHPACPPQGPRGLAPPSPSLTLCATSDPCPPSARAVPVLSSPSLPTTAHPVLAPTTTYHPPDPGGQFLSEFLPTLPGLGRPTELPGSSPFQSQAARRRRAAPLNQPFITHIPHPATRKCCCTGAMTVVAQPEGATWDKLRRKSNPVEHFS